MQIFENETPADVSKRLRALCENAGLTNCVDLVLDLYVLCQSPNPQTAPDQALLEGIAMSDPDYWGVKTSINKRKAFLTKMNNCAYVQEARKLGDASKAVMLFIDAMTKGLKSKNATTLTGALFDWSPQSMPPEAATIDKAALEKAIESSLSGLHYTDFPEDDFAAALECYVEAVEQPVFQGFFSGGGCGLSRSSKFTIFSNGVLSAELIKAAKSMPPCALRFFQEFTALTETIGTAAEKQKDTPNVTDKKKTDKMEDFSQLETADPLESAKEGFEQKVAEKNLNVEFHKEPQKGKCHVFVLIDVSGSMANGFDAQVILARATACNVIALALLNLAISDGWHVHIVPFAGYVNERQILSATDKVSAVQAARRLGTFGYDGSSTDIESAIMYAYSELQADPNYRKCDIVLITDGESPVSEGVWQKKPPKTKLRVLQLGALDMGSPTDNLAKAADSFAHVTWDPASNHLSVGNSLNGLSDKSSEDT